MPRFLITPEGHSSLKKHQVDIVILLITVKPRLQHHLVAQFHLPTDLMSWDDPEAH